LKPTLPLAINKDYLAKITYNAFALKKQEEFKAVNLSQIMMKIFSYIKMSDY
jgi:hypothetical protein